MKLNKILLFLFSLIFLNQVTGQDHSNIYRTDLEEFLNKTYSFDHTFLHILNPDVPQLDCSSTEKDSLELNEYKAVHFLDHFMDHVPKETNVIIISENHLIYQSRELLASMIQQLKEEGFENVYIEALNYDKDLKARGFPIKNSGYLINEPIFAELVRELLDSGFNIYPYEQQDFQKESSKRSVLNHFKEEKNQKKIKKERINNEQYTLETSSSFLEMSIRDFSQYKNIMQTFDPSKKSIILCGHGHGMKKPYGGWRPLGYWLSSNPKIKLFSIENSEAISQEETELNKFTCLFDQQEPYFLLSKQDGNIYNEFRYQPYESKNINGLFDMNTFYPINYATTEVNSWKNSEDCEKIILPKNKHNTPFLIIKYIKNEYEAFGEQAIPIDILTVNNQTEKININRCEDEIIFIWARAQKHELKE